METVKEEKQERREEITDRTIINCPPLEEGGFMVKLLNPKKIFSFGELLMPEVVNKKPSRGCL